jgi:transposase
MMSDTITAPTERTFDVEQWVRFSPELATVLKLSKIGEIEVILHRQIPLCFEIKQATILKKADGWYVSFSLEDKTVPATLPV